MVRVIKSGDTNVAAKGIFFKDDLILLVKPTGSKHRYDIPGGKVKVGESKEQGLFRECLEETGLRIKKAKFVGQNIEREKRFFLVTEWDGEIVLQPEELEKYRWVPIDVVLQYRLTKTAAEGIQLILDTI
jgi:8-oxo-dGTP pyrophosphatase MutT (NUDIX family)